MKKYKLEITTEQINKILDNSNLTRTAKQTLAKSGLIRDFREVEALLFDHYNGTAPLLGDKPKILYMVCVQMIANTPGGTSYKRRLVNEFKKRIGCERLTLEGCEDSDIQVTVSDILDILTDVEDNIEDEADPWTAVRGVKTKVAELLNIIRNDFQDLTESYNEVVDGASALSERLDGAVVLEPANLDDSVKVQDVLKIFKYLDSEKIAQIVKDEGLQYKDPGTGDLFS